MFYNIRGRQALYHTRTVRVHCGIWMEGEAVDSTCLAEEKAFLEHMQPPKTVGILRANVEWGALEIVSDNDICHSWESDQTFQRPPGKGNKQWGLWDLRGRCQRIHRVWATWAVNCWFWRKTSSWGKCVWCTRELSALN